MQTYIYCYKFAVLDWTLFEAVSPIMGTQMRIAIKVCTMRLTFICFGICVLIVDLGNSNLV